MSIRRVSARGRLPRPVHACTQSAACPSPSLGRLSSSARAGGPWPIHAHGPSMAACAACSWPLSISMAHPCARSMPVRMPVVCAHVRGPSMPGAVRPCPHVPACSWSSPLPVAAPVCLRPCPAATSHAADARAVTRHWTPSTGPPAAPPSSPSSSPASMVSSSPKVSSCIVFACGVSRSSCGVLHRLQQLLCGLLCQGARVPTLLRGSAAASAGQELPAGRHCSTHRPLPPPPSSSSGIWACCTLPPPTSASPTFGRSATVVVRKTANDDVSDSVTHPRGPHGSTHRGQGGSTTCERPTPLLHAGGLCAPRPSPTQHRRQRRPTPDAHHAVGETRTSTRGRHRRHDVAAVSTRAAAGLKHRTATLCGHSARF